MQYYYQKDALNTKFLLLRTRLVHFFNGHIVYLAHFHYTVWIYCQHRYQRWKNKILFKIPPFFILAYWQKSVIQLDPLGNISESKLRDSSMLLQLDESVLFRWKWIEPKRSTQPSREEDLVSIYLQEARVEFLGIGKIKKGQERNGSVSFYSFIGQIFSPFTNVLALFVAVIKHPVRYPTGILSPRFIVGRVCISATTAISLMVALNECTRGEPTSEFLDGNVVA